MKGQTGFNGYIHYTMSLIGGFMGAYALLSRFEIFGSAQTANLIHMVMDLIGGSFLSLCLRAGALIIFIGAIAAASLLPRYTRINLHLFCILTEIIVIIALGFFPASTNPFIALYPVFFIMPLQWCTFTSLDGYVSSTIFSTNNLRQFITALCDYAGDKEKTHLKRARIYGSTLLSYHIGVAAAFFTTRVSGVHAAWFCLLPLFTALILELAEPGHNHSKVQASEIILP